LNKVIELELELNIYRNIIKNLDPVLQDILHIIKGKDREIEYLKNITKISNYDYKK